MSKYLSDTYKNIAVREEIENIKTQMGVKK